MTMLAKLSVIIALAFLVSASANADPAKARLIQKGVTAFECSIFVAFKSQNGDAESARFFQIGYDSTLEFLRAFDAGEVTEEEFRSFVRFDVALNLKRMGDTHPAFEIGRVYQDVREFALNRVMYERTASGAIDFETSREDAERTTVAKQLYHKTSCALID